MSIYMNKDGNVECVAKVDGLESQYICVRMGAVMEKKKNEYFKLHKRAKRIHAVFDFVRCLFVDVEGQRLKVGRRDEVAYYEIVK